MTEGQETWTKAETNEHCKPRRQITSRNTQNPRTKEQEIQIRLTEFTGYNRGSKKSYLCAPHTASKREKSVIFQAAHSVRFRIFTWKKVRKSTCSSFTFKHFK